MSPKASCFSCWGEPWDLSRWPPFEIRRVPLLARLRRGTLLLLILALALLLGLVSAADPAFCCWSSFLLLFRCWS